MVKKKKIRLPTKEMEIIQGWENPLAEDMATHSSVLPWRIPWTEKLGGL